MLCLTICCLLTIVVTATSSDPYVPAVGDVGTISHCIPGTDDDAAEECESCFREREEKEDENGEMKNEIMSSTQMCIDTCSHSGYRITQLAPVNVTDPDSGTAAIHRQILLEPNVACVDGCHCPTATGSYEEPVPEDDDGYDDDDGVEPERYDLIFHDKFGNVDGGYVEGELNIEAFDKDGLSRTNAVHLKIAYKTLEVKQDEDGEREEEVKIEDCRVQFFIDSGKVGGIAATSGAMPSAVVPVTEGYDYGVVEMVAGGDDAKANCTADDFEVDSADWCSYKCAQKYSVQRIDASMWYMPSVRFVSLNCLCSIGIGSVQQKDSAGHYGMVSFDPTDEICTSKFDSTNAVNALAGNAAYGGTVLQWTPHGPTVGKGDGSGRTTVAILVSFGFVIAFFIPSFMQ